MVPAEPARQVLPGRDGASGRSYLKGVVPPHVTINEIFRGVMPYLILVVISMALLYIFPGVGLWLPEAIYSR